MMKTENAAARVAQTGNGGENAGKNEATTESYMQWGLKFVQNWNSEPV
jgi:hypothetical protein